MITILVNGAKGQMGQHVVRALAADSRFIVVAQTDKDDNLQQTLKNIHPDVAVDFTVASAAEANLTTIIDAGVRPVIGTSGLSKITVEAAIQRCQEQKLGGIIAPNFSIGAVLMMQIAAQISAHFPDAEIIEYHHPNKQDAPSATAIRTAEIITEHRQRSPIIPTPDAPARGDIRNNIPIHAVRLPGLVAHQTLLFGGHHETLTIRHDTLDRQSFMPGVLLACERVMKLETLVYGLDALL